MKRYGDFVIYAMSFLQKCIALSFTEAVYLALAYATKTVHWLRKKLVKLNIPQRSMKIYQDNLGALKYVKRSTAKIYSDKSIYRSNITTLTA